MLNNKNAFLIAFQLLSCIKSDTNDNGNTLNRLLTNYIGDTENTCRWINIAKCDITCSSIATSLISSSLENLYDQIQEKSCESISLSLTNCAFPKNTITNGWLSSKFPINKLTIQDNASINHIEINAFNSMAFYKTADLKISNPNIQFIKHGIFRGLSKLTTLALFQWPIIKMEPNILEHIPWLQTLQIEETHGSLLNLRNITGSGKIDGLQTVSLRYNNLCRTIDGTTFTGLSGVLSLYLSNSKIRSISSNAFHSIADTIQQIYLDGNYLKTLSTKLFEKFILNGNWRIYLNENQWECNCELTELKEIIKKQPNNFVDSIICYKPITMSGNNILDISLEKCAEKQNYLNTCKSCQDSVQSIIKIENHPEITNEIIVKVQLNDANDYELIWFDSNFTSKTINLTDDDSISDMCPEQFQKNAKVKNLSNGLNYAFCVIKKYSSTLLISPLDCTAYFVKSDNFHDLSEHSAAEDKSFVFILIFIILIICALLFGIIFGVCLAKRYPTFVKSTSSKVVIQQLNHNEHWRKTERNPKKLYRSVSDASVASSRSYITAVAPSQFEMLNWKLQKRISSEIQKRSINLENLSSPPPIPSRKPPKLEQSNSRVCSMEREMQMMKKAYRNQIDSTFV